jgi:hypothetical protein
MKLRKRQRGAASLEFAAIGLLLFAVIFAVIEVARALYVWNTISEATRRGARVAAVCPIGHSAIGRVTVFGDPLVEGDSPVLPDLSAIDNVSVEYMLDDGEIVSSESARDPAVFPNIRFVRVGITDYQHDMIIPLFGTTLDVPNFATTLPVESLGYDPGKSQRECFGAVS